MVEPVGQHVPWPKMKQMVVRSDRLGLVTSGFSSYRGDRFSYLLKRASVGVLSIARVSVCNLYQEGDSQHWCQRRIVIVGHAHMHFQSVLLSPSAQRCKLSKKREVSGPPGIEMPCAIAKTTRAEHPSFLRKWPLPAKR